MGMVGTWALAFFSGVILCVAFIFIVKVRFEAKKRKKTKLGLVKVAGAGWSFDEEQSATDSEQERSQPATDSVAPPINSESAVSSGVDAATMLATSDQAGSEAASAAYLSECEETIAMPMEMLDEYDDESEIQDTLQTAQEPVSNSKPIDDSVKPVSNSNNNNNNNNNNEPVSNSNHSDIEPSDDTDSISSVENEFINDDYNEFINDDDESGIDESITGEQNKFKPAPKALPLVAGTVKNMKPLSSFNFNFGDKKAVSKKRLPETVKMRDRMVLLAEDVAVNRDLISMFFEGTGVKFDFARNGLEVCEKFEQNPKAYSLILMDIQMPVLDGYEAARKIRALDSDWARQIPIIAMTANFLKDDIDACFDAGMDDHVAKPVEMEDLQNKVFEILSAE